VDGNAGNVMRQLECENISNPRGLQQLTCFGLSADINTSTWHPTPITSNTKLYALKKTLSVIYVNEGEVM
jgi:hypothetical protein